MRQFPSHHNSPPLSVDAKNVCGTGSGSLCAPVLQTEAACSFLVFHHQVGKWALIFPLEMFSEPILPLCHLHRPWAVAISLRCQGRAVGSAGAHPECHTGWWGGRGHQRRDDADPVRLPHRRLHLRHRVHRGVCLLHGECCCLRGLTAALLLLRRPEMD